MKTLTTTRIFPAVVGVCGVLVLMIAVPTSADAVSVGMTCGGYASVQCDAGLFCEHGPGQCSLFDATGVCARKPRFCPQITGPELQVCGCDGQTFGNDCMRQQAAASLAHKGACM